MSIQAYPITVDPVIGTNDSVYDNTWDSVNIDINTALGVDHTGGTSHIFTAYSGPCIIERGTYTGDGNDNHQINLTNTTMNVLFVQVGLAGYSQNLARTSIMPAGHGMALYIAQNAYEDELFGSSAPMGTGYFRVGPDTNTGQTNGNGFSFEYVAFGIPPSLPTGDTTFTPTWMQHGERIILDASSDGAPTRASKQILSRYQNEHDDNGEHGFNCIQIGTYTGNGGTQTISLDFDPSIVLVWNVSIGRYAILQVSNLPSGESIRLDNAAFASDLISLGTASFSLLSSNQDVNNSSDTYYYVAFS